MYAYPWGEKSTTLANHAGPDKWQVECLREIGELVAARGFNGTAPVSPIREAIASGHGIGKSTLVAWIVNWIMSTRPLSQGTVTANTFVQLQTKTWASIQKWTKLCVTSHWWKIGADRISHKQKPESWFCSAQTCREENSEAFAGQHAADSTSYYIFDEASNVPDKIFEVAEGGLTDGEPMFFAFGNPTRKDGKFYRVCFGSERSSWKSRSIDSRDAKFTNKELIAEWVQIYGEDSDFVRVRVRGLAPSASDLQYIDSNRVYEAQRRVVSAFPDDPLILGCDLARGGADSCSFRFRRGLDARSIKPIKLNGEETRNPMVTAAKIADILDSPWNGEKITACFVDDTGGFGIADRLKQLGYKKVHGIQFGWNSPDVHFANMRAYMWAQMKEWLMRGSIDSSSALETDLTGPGFKHNSRDQLLLEAKEDMKKRGLDSPDDGDSLALTFAQKVAPPQRIVSSTPMRYSEASSTRSVGWMR